MIRFDQYASSVQVLNQTSRAAQGPKRGLSLEEKRTKIMDIFLETKDVYQLKVRNIPPLPPPRRCLPQSRFHPLHLTIGHEHHNPKVLSISLPQLSSTISTSITFIRSTMAKTEADTWQHAVQNPKTEFHPCCHLQRRQREAHHTLYSAGPVYFITKKGTQHDGDNSLRKYATVAHLDLRTPASQLG